MSDTALTTGETKSSIEEWLKRGTICLAFIYVNGSISFHAYASTLGLSSSDFALDDKDYFIQGIRFLLLDSQAVLHPCVDYAFYFVLVAATWVLLFVVVSLAFRKIAPTASRQTFGYSIQIALVFVALNFVAAHGGVLAAKLTAQSFDRLPPVMVCYSSPEDEKSLNCAAGRLLARTDKVVCLVSLTLQLIGTNPPVAYENDKRVLIIRNECVNRIEEQVPQALKRLSDKNQ